MDRRVVITGIGAVSAAGLGAEAFWEMLESGGCGIGPISAFDAGGFGSRLAGEAAGVSARTLVPKSYRKATKVMARDTELAVAAAQLAAKDANVATRGSGETTGHATDEHAFAIDLDRAGCQIGAGLIAAETDELTRALATSTDEEGRFSLRRWGSAEGGDGAMNNLPPLWMLKYLPNMLACHVTIIHGLRGPSNTVTCAEASGLLSIGEAARVIERGDADVCFAGGAESKINPLGMLRLMFAKRLAETAEGDEAEPGSIVRPYDPAARGSVVGEGGAIFVVEEAAKASARGAEPYAEIAGYGAGQSAEGVFPGLFDDAEPVNRGLRRAIAAAIEDAGLEPGDIDAIVPTALGIPAVDSGEAGALREVFGDRLGEVPLITITPAVGNAMAGHAGLQLAAGALAIRHQRLPARLHGGSPDRGLRAGRADSDAAMLRAVLVCTTALGGQNGAIVLKDCRGL